jgi:hypothetical protein
MTETHPFDPTRPPSSPGAPDEASAIFRGASDGRRASGQPRSVGSVLARLMARTGYAREQSRGGLESAWTAAAPESLRGRSRPGAVRKGVLEVVVDHPLLVQEMGFAKETVLERLRAAVPDEGIVDLRCRVGDVS